MKEILKNAIKKALEKLNVGDIEIEINKPTLQENGDYSSNIAMKLARVLKKNPLEIANEIANNISDDNIKRGLFYMTAMSTHLYARIESKVKSSKRIVDMSVLSEEELNEELEKGYADVQAGRTKNAKTAFDNIRKDYQLNT